MASGSRGRQITTLAARVPRNPWHCPVSSTRRPRHRPIAPSPSQTSTRGTAPSPAISRHQPANRSSARRVGTSTAHAHRAYPVTIVSTGNCAAVRTCPNPHETVTGGNHKSHWAISPAAYAVRDAGSGGRYAGRSSATFPLNVRIEYGLPIRSAITVEGIDGYAASSSRIRGSNASATDPCGFRTYFGGLSLASAAFTVFREIPITRAISAIGICSARLSRRISAQSSTLSTCFLPDSAPARVSGKLVNFRLPRCGQYSVAADTRGLRQTVRACPLASTAVGGDCHLVRHSVAREPVVSDCCPPTCFPSLWVWVRRRPGESATSAAGRD